MGPRETYKPLGQSHVGLGVALLTGQTVVLDGHEGIEGVAKLSMFVRPSDSGKRDVS